MYMYVCVCVSRCVRVCVCVSRGVCVCVSSTNRNPFTALLCFIDGMLLSFEHSISEPHSHLRHKAGHGASSY